MTTDLPAQVPLSAGLGAGRPKREHPVCTLTAAELNHLRRLLGWVRCEVEMPPEVMVQTAQGLAAAGAFSEGISDEGKARMVEWHQQLSNVPQYVRAALKALEKTLLAHPECMPEAEDVGPPALPSPNVGIEPHLPAQEQR